MAKVHRLPDALRAELARPLGRLFPAAELAGSEFSRMLKTAQTVISVGDRVTETLGAAGRIPDVQIVDGLENRKERAPPSVHFARLIEVENPPGTLSEEAIEGVRSAFEGEKPARVMVRGEEDLMAIPVIALAPPDAVVFYGQPGEGIVAVVADKRTKARNRGILYEMGIPELR